MRVRYLTSVLLVLFAAFACPGCIIRCIAKGEGIRTPSGIVAIEDLRPGDLVFSVDDSGANAISKVTSIERHRAVRHLTITVEGKAGLQALRLTPEHPVLVNGDWLPAGRLRVGASLISSAASLRVANVAATSGSASVYTIGVEPWENFVHASGVVCHNKRRIRFEADAPDLGTLIGFDAKSAELLVLYANGETPTRFDRFVEGEGWHSDSFDSWGRYGRTDYRVGTMAQQEGQPSRMTENRGFPDLNERNRFVWEMRGVNRTSPSHLIRLSDYRDPPKLIGINKDYRDQFKEVVKRLDAFFTGHPEVRLPEPRLR